LKADNFAAPRIDELRRDQPIPWFYIINSWPRLLRNDFKIE